MTFEKNDLELSPFDVAEYVDTPEMQSEYLSAAFETGDPASIWKALVTLVRAQGMRANAKGADVTREAFPEALLEGGDPRLSTLLRLLAALGLRLGSRPVT